jgi:glycerol-3-phosphate acyltransferase PlsY
MAIEFGLLIAAAYLLGSVPTAYLVAKWFRSVDIRRYGSGNVGATNLLALTSKRLTIPVIVFDLAKGGLMVVASQTVGLSIAQQITVGLAAIIGHNWPVFLRFNGGRGLLTTIGVIITTSLVNRMIPWSGLIGFSIFLCIYYTLHNVPLATFIAMAALPLVSWLIGDPASLTLGYLAIVLIFIIRRLLARTQFKVVSTGRKQLICNRLLFDRDIRDRETWLRRISEQTGDK